MAKIAVAPLVGAWIEMCCAAEKSAVSSMSLPSWERGLKSTSPFASAIDELVAPLVGAWIEMSLPALMRRWSITSLPSWERGLK